MNLNEQLMRVATGASPKKLLTSQEAAELLSISPSTLRSWRCRDETHPALAAAERWLGPQTLRYDLDALQAYIDQVAKEGRARTEVAGANLGPGRRTPSRPADA